MPNLFNKQENKGKKVLVVAHAGAYAALVSTGLLPGPSYYGSGRIVKTYLKNC
jgi:hypothetical protein